MFFSALCQKCSPSDITSKEFVLWIDFIEKSILLLEIFGERNDTEILKFVIKMDLNRLTRNCLGMKISERVPVTRNSQWSFLGFVEKCSVLSLYVCKRIVRSSRSYHIWLIESVELRFFQRWKRSHNHDCANFRKYYYCCKDDRSWLKCETEEVQETI